MSQTMLYTVETEFTLIDHFSKALDKAGACANVFNNTVGASFLRAQKAWESFGGAAAQAARSFGAAALGAAVDAGRKYVEFEDVLTKAGSKFVDLDVTSATYAEDLDALSKAAQKVGAVTKYSASDAAGALDKMAMAGLTSKQSMALLMGTTNLATAAGIDLTGAVDMATDSLGMFGMMKDAAGNPLDEAGLEASMNRIADVVAKTTNMANLDMGMWFEAAKQGASAFTSFGGSIEEFSAVAGILANDGIKGSAGGTAIRNIMLGMAGTTKPARDALAALGVEVYDAEGKMRPFASLIEQLSAGLSGLGDEDKAAYLSDLFGKENISPALMLVNEGADKIREYTDALKVAGGTASTIARAQEKSLAGQLASLSSAIEAKQLQFGEALQKSGGNGFLAKIIAEVQAFDLSPVIEVAGAAFNKLGEIIFGVVDYVKANGLAEAFDFSSVLSAVRSVDVGPIVESVGNLVLLLGKVSGFLVSHGDLVFRTLEMWLGYKAAMMALVPAVKGVGLAMNAVSAGRAVYRGISQGAVIASRSLAGLGESAQMARQFASPLGRAFGTAFTGIGTAAKAAFSGIKTAMNAAFVSSPVGWVVLAVAALVALVAAVTTHWDEWGRTATGVIGAIIPPLGILLGVAHSIYERWDEIKAAFAEQGFLAGLGAVGDAIRAGVVDALMAVKDIVSRIPGIGGILGDGIDFVVRQLDLVCSAAGAIRSAFADGGILDGLLAIGRGLLSFVLAPAEGLLKALSYIPGADWAESAYNAISGFRDSLSGAGAEAGVVRTTRADFAPTVSSARAEQYSRSESVSRSEVELRLAAGLEASPGAAAPGITVRRHSSGGF